MKKIYNITIRVGHWDTLDASLACFSIKRKMVLRLLMASVLCLQSSLQEGDILEHTYGKCHLCTL